MSMNNLFASYLNKHGILFCCYTDDSKNNNKVEFATNFEFTRLRSSLSKQVRVYTIKMTANAGSLKEIRDYQETS